MPQFWRFVRVTGRFHSHRQSTKGPFWACTRPILAPMGCALPRAGDVVADNRSVWMEVVSVDDHRMSAKKAAGWFRDWSPLVAGVDLVAGRNSGLWRTRSLEGITNGPHDNDYQRVEMD